MLCYYLWLISGVSSPHFGFFVHKMETLIAGLPPSQVVERIVRTQTGHADVDPLVLLLSDPEGKGLIACGRAQQAVRVGMFREAGMREV